MAWCLSADFEKECGLTWHWISILRPGYCKTPIIRMLEIFPLFASSKKTRKIGSELCVSERLTFDRKITSAQIDWLEDSAKISRRKLQAFYSIKQYKLSVLMSSWWHRITFGKTMMGSWPSRTQKYTKPEFDRYFILTCSQATTHTKLVNAFNLSKNVQSRFSLCVVKLCQSQ